MNFRFSDQEIKEAYLDLKSTQEVANRVGCCSATVLHYLRRLNIPYPRRDLTSEEISSILNLYQNEDISINGIAKQLGHDSDTISKCLKQNNIQLKQAGYYLRKFKDSDLTEAKRLYCEEGLSLELIASRFGVSSEIIRRGLEKLDIPRRTAAEAYFLAKVKGRRKTLQGWEPGRSISPTGYVRIKCVGHPRANSEGYVSEHILVWEKYHNKPLPKGYVIHHLNGITSDNRPENLKAMSEKRHSFILEPYKKRIRQLEIENEQLKRCIQTGQFMLNIGEN